MQGVRDTLGYLLQCPLMFNGSTSGCYPDRPGSNPGWAALKPRNRNDQRFGAKDKKNSGNEGGDRGNLTPEEINDKIDAWHQGDAPDLELYEYVGLTRDQWFVWLYLDVIPPVEDAARIKNEYMKERIERLKLREERRNDA